MKQRLKMAQNVWRHLEGTGMQGRAALRLCMFSLS